MDCGHGDLIEDGVPAAPTRAWLKEQIDRLALARRRLAGRSLDEILAVLESVVESWLDPVGPFMPAAVTRLPAATGFSPEMVRVALPFMIEPLRAPSLGRLLDAELGGRRLLDCASSGRKAGGPGLVAHLLPGNLPGLAAVAVGLTLAIKSAALVKAGRGDRVFPRLFVESIAAADAELAECIAPLYWQGGNRDIEDVVLAAADLVVAYGDDRTIADLCARRRGPFIGHGHRVSFAVVAAEVASDPAGADAAAAALALDTALWDQRGCLSPQLCYVEGDLAAARSFGERLFIALRDVAGRLPPGSSNLAERVAVRHLREEAEWRAFGRQATTLFAADELTQGTVVVEPEAVFRPSPLGRSLRVLPLAGPEALVRALEPARSLLEAAGLAAAPDREGSWKRTLHECGVHRVCSLGEMQRPPLDWRQGGRPRVADWVTWTAGSDD
jgi:hypothetical protein